MFITLEGVEGSGKSTLSSSLASAIEKNGDATVLLTRQPGATPVGKQIRQILLDTKNTSLVPRAELFLFAADRAQHVEEEIRPSLARGEVVICDRYIDSTIAYQGYGRGLDIKMLNELNALATGGLNPDLTLLLDLDPKLGLERARNRELDGATQWSRFEADELAFHQRVRDGFLKLATAERTRFVVIDASVGKDEILKSALSAVTNHLRTRC